MRGFHGLRAGALVLLAIAGATTTASAQQQSAPAIPRPHVDLGPHFPIWLEFPTAEQVAQVYPAAAARDRLEGTVLLDCTINVEGKPVGCVVFLEFTPGHGFGEAALKLAPFMRASPRMAYGRPVAAPDTKFPVDFRLPH